MESICDRLVREVGLNSYQIISPKEVNDRIIMLSEKLRAMITGRNVVFLVLLNGGVKFSNTLLNLVSDLSYSFSTEYLKTSSYNGTLDRSKLSINFDNTLFNKLTDKTVIIIDDVFDSGETIKGVSDYLKSNGIDEVLSCVLIKKDLNQEFSPNLYAMTSDNSFLVGYGLDYDDRYRELDCIIKLR